MKISKLRELLASVEARVGDVDIMIIDAEDNCANIDGTEPIIQAGKSIYIQVSARLDTDAY